MTDRDAFEAHFKLTIRQYAKHKDGSYCDPITQARWEGWQALAPDAMRYRWLRDKSGADHATNGFWGECLLVVEIDDAAIDAKMQEDA